MISWLLSSSLAKRYRLNSTHVYVATISLIAASIFAIYLLVKGSTECEISGPNSSAPMNEAEFLRGVDSGLNFLKLSSSNDSHAFQGNVISTCINEEAAIHNFPAFIHSAKHVTPPLLPIMLIFCLDEAACRICHEHGLHKEQCIHMDLGVTGNSLAPGGSDKQDKDYWRLTYGRVFATVALVRPGINAVPVDVDAVFLQNPFVPGNGIANRPNDIAVVSDIAPFTFKYGDKTPINGGFLYFPGKNPQAYRYSKEAVDRIWARNCHPKSNEQLVTSSVMRYLAKEYAKDPNFRPHMLSVDKYLNFCSTTCGTDKEFASISSVEDLRRLEAKWFGKEGFEKCTEQARKQWVYFHAACLNKDVLKDKDAVAKAKGAIQRAVYEWVKSG